MTIIEVRPCNKFKGAWVAFEAPGVEPAFPDPNGKQDAIDYARGRFGGSRDVYGDDASTIRISAAADKRFSDSSKLRFTLPVEGWWTQRAEARR